jgi:hypothetical protein
MINNARKIDIQFNSWFDRIRFWRLLRRIRQEKNALIWEASMDKFHILTNFNDELMYEDKEDREKLAEENKKPLDKQDKVMIRSLEDKISFSAAVKTAYRKNDQAIEESKKYIGLINTTLKEWKNLF